MDTPDITVEHALTAVRNAVDTIVDTHTDPADRLAALTHLNNGLYAIVREDIPPHRRADARTLKDDGWTLARIAAHIGVSVAQADNLVHGRGGWKSGGK